MSERQASRTAEGAALLRAAHQVLDGEPKILDDPLAVHLLGPASREALRAGDPLRDTTVRLARAATVLGGRFIEDELMAAAERGVRQYVLLGAGFDTFAYRQPRWAADLRTIEVDHPASQECKLERLAAAGVRIPQNVAYIPVDFELTTLADGMALGGFDARLPAFFAWRGVTQYPTRSGIEATLRHVLSLPRSSGIAMTFCLPDAAAEEDEAAVRFFAEYGAGLGEPWVSRFEPERMVQWLRELGFGEITHLTPEAAGRRYFGGRSDGLRVPIYEQVVSAVV